MTVLPRNRFDRETIKIFSITFPDGYAYYAERDSRDCDVGHLTLRDCTLHTPHNLQNLLNFCKNTLFSRKLLLLSAKPTEKINMQNSLIGVM